VGCGNRQVRKVTDLKAELEAVNVKHQNRKTTHEDIDYLTDLSRCAHKKLSWQKQIASLQKRTLIVLENMARLMNDPTNPPDEPTRDQMVQSLQAVQSIMERLQNVKLS